ncbi:aspartate/glutamate racemase family protein [Streptomyces sp. NPDC044780]|uniref:aspartate/glutamate racemase family protein n=1 Tax=unclassified Streptomyces TaxID=2593676 RepID=UPI0022A80E1C|nr:aspartate/glutamate racemase family protein [Streptomyces sp. S465]WAP58434.1 aspartate/glutamate racemase family protein [Streptomyces sp. S465]
MSVPSSAVPARPIGVIRVLTSDDPAAVAAHGRVIEERYGLPTVSRCIPDQPHGIHDDASEARAEPKIVALARELADAGAHALIISCAADPALQETRQAVGTGVPVIGAGSAAAAVALGLGRRIGVLGIRDEAPPAVRAVLGDRFTASARPHGVHRTTDLLAPEGPAAVLEAAAGLVAAGADTLLLACTGLNTIGVRPLLERRLGVPVVDPVLAAGLLASYGRAD